MNPADAFGAPPWPAGSVPPVEPDPNEGAPVYGGPPAAAPPTGWPPAPAASHPAPGYQYPAPDGGQGGAPYPPYYAAPYPAASPMAGRPVPGATSGYGQPLGSAPVPQSPGWPTGYGPGQSGPPSGYPSAGGYAPGRPTMPPNASQPAITGPDLYERAQQRRRLARLLLTFGILLGIVALGWAGIAMLGSRVHPLTLLGLHGTATPAHVAVASPAATTAPLRQPTPSPTPHCHIAIPTGIPPMYPQEILTTANACLFHVAKAKTNDQFTGWGASTFQSWDMVTAWFHGHLPGNGWYWLPSDMLKSLQNATGATPAATAPQQQVYGLVNYQQRKIFVVMLRAGNHGVIEIVYFLYPLPSS